MTDDSKLWQRLNEGDEEAFQQIYRKHIKSLYDYACRFQTNKDVIKDCLQEVFVDLWQRREQLIYTERIEFYLFKSLKTRLLRGIEQQKKFVVNEEGLLDFLITPSIEQDILDEQYNDEKLTRLREAMKQLSERQQEALYLRFFKNVDYVELAEILQMEQQSAYNLVFRAIQALRKHLTDWLILAWCLFS